MTYSIVARDGATGHTGIAVASRFFAVGALVPFMDGRVAMATQAFVNPLWGVEGLDALAGGTAASQVIAALVARDPGAPHRQAHALDASGRVAAHTGSACVPWAGHLAGPGVSLAGNMLAGPEVLQAAYGAWLAGEGTPMPDRLLAAMVAGEAAGGDKRGRQSAAIRVHRGERYAWLDLRADDHADPLAELERLLAVARERYVYFAEQMGTAARFEGVIDRTDFDMAMAQLDAERRAAGIASRSAATPALNADASTGAGTDAAAGLAHARRPIRA